MATRGNLGFILPDRQFRELSRSRTPIEGLIERIRFLVNSVIRSRLPHQWSSDNTIRIHTHEKQRVLIDHVGREVECCCRIGLQVGGEVVGLCTITAERQVPIQGAVEEIGVVVCAENVPSLMIAESIS